MKIKHVDMNPNIKIDIPVQEVRHFYCNYLPCEEGERGDKNTPSKTIKIKPDAHCDVLYNASLVI
ncbi:hypothetical protein Avbf_02495 [Armadillidium vulgare]|nr:hypothetical protein Avbf_02495 [Armadillidium vulgare]